MSRERRSIRIRDREAQTRMGRQTSKRERQTDREKWSDMGDCIDDHHFCV